MGDNIPPHDLTAEQFTLGAMMLNNKTISEVMQVVKGGDFYRPNNALIFDAIVSLYSRGEPADPVTVHRELGKLAEKVGGAKALLDMHSSVPTATNASAYAKIVSQHSRLRRLADVGSQFQRLAYDSPVDEADEIIVTAERFFREVTAPSAFGSRFCELVGQWRDWQTRPDDIISTPWPELNEYLGGGLRRGKLYVVGGRPGAGKSLAGLNMAAHVAEQGRKTVVFSMEMVATEVTSRLLAFGAWANYGEIFRKRMSEETLERVNAYIESHPDLNLEVVDRASIKVEEICAHIRANSPDCVFVDYCQLISASDTRVGRREQIDHITRSLKVAAAESGCAIILASQVNRSPATGGRAPTIADLRESGGIENDADVVMLLHRDELMGGCVQLHVGKNRDGRMGTIDLTFRGEIARIGN